MKDVGKSLNDVSKAEDTRFPTNGDIIVMVLDKTDGVFCKSPKRNILVAYDAYYRILFNINDIPNSSIAIC